MEIAKVEHNLEFEYWSSGNITQTPSWSLIEKVYFLKIGKNLFIAYSKIPDKSQLHQGTSHKDNF